MCIQGKPDDVATTDIENIKQVSILSNGVWFSTFRRLSVDEHQPRTMNTPVVMRFAPKHPRKLPFGFQVAF
jgi:hypothetical protein